AGRAVACCEAQEGATHAGAWLTSVRPYTAGWGFNAATGPDADSTAYALCLLREVGQAAAPADEAWLQDRWLPGRGFATYDRLDNWGLAHPDVTPIAFRALCAEAQSRLRPDAIDY